MEIGQENGDEGNYEKAHEHWVGVSSNVGGMLGGFEKLHSPDINGSKQFLDELAKKNFLLHFGKALDCGSGIGRVTKHLLLPSFQSVDMVDFAENFIQQSAAYLGKEDNSRVGQKFVESLHTFSPELDHYDLIWVQWVTGHLSEEHFIEFLERCKEALRDGGIIVVKDNVAKGREKDFDEIDHSWTRPMADLHSIFERAGCKIVQTKRQLHFPKNIYAVWMFALKPETKSSGMEK